MKQFKVICSVSKACLFVSGFQQCVDYAFHILFSTEINPLLMMHDKDIERYAIVESFKTKNSEINYAVHYIIEPN